MPVFDDRTLYGVSVWAKPFKFSLSFLIYFGTLAWFTPLMPSGYFATIRGRVLTWTPVVCAVFELAYIAYQASLGEPSHFNISTPFHANMYRLMGIGAVTLVTMCLWMGVSILRERGTADPYALAVGLGLILSFLLGGGFGGYLSAQTSHWVGGAGTDANGLWLVKWVRDGGDLRVAHFFGMHAMQVLPLLALLIPKRPGPTFARSIVLGIASAYAAFTILTFAQALNGKAFPA